MLYYNTIAIHFIKTHYITIYSFKNTSENAFTMGMDEDLDLNSSVYNWSLTMFFIGYIMLVLIYFIVYLLDSCACASVNNNNDNHRHHRNNNSPL